VAGASILACAAFLAWPTERFVEAFLRASRGRERIGSLLFFHEGATDTVAVVTKDYGFHDPGAKSLITNGVAMSATVKPVWRYMSAEGHLPVLMAAEPRRALAIGVGTGITLAAVVSHPEVERIDAVELSEGVLRALRSFDDENGRADLDPRVRIVRDDGRRFLERTRERFDVVTVEPPPPIVAGSSNLYSLDFYRLVRRALRPGGVTAQWLPLHAQSLASARMTARTFLAAFPHVQLWLPSVRDAVLLGSDRPLALDVARLDAAYATPATEANLRDAYLETPEALLGAYLLDRDGIERWAGPGAILTDERPLMEFFRSQGSNMGDREIATLLEIPQASLGWTTGLDETRARAVENENAALRLYVRSQARDSVADAVDAARRARGTEFLRYRLGCAGAQLDALPAGAEAQRARCRDLGPPPSLLR
jgi:spermidine synthase